jgi:hypothetical protein
MAATNYYRGFEFSREEARTIKQTYAKEHGVKYASAARWFERHTTTTGTQRRGEVQKQSIAVFRKTANPIVKESRKGETERQPKNYGIGDGPPESMALEGRFTNRADAEAKIAALLRGDVDKSEKWIAARMTSAKVEFVLPGAKYRVWDKNTRKHTVQTAPKGGAYVVKVSIHQHASTTVDDDAEEITGDELDG